MRYRRRTLLILGSVLPPVLAAIWFDWMFAVAIGIYLGALAALLPLAGWLWRNSSRH
jgi:hypothetical protein